MGTEVIRLFNGIFENSLRILLLLDVYDAPQTVDMLYAVDFMAVYGKTFSISDRELNGDNDYKFSEFVSRRSSVQAAMKNLVRKGLAAASESRRGFEYSITIQGKQYAEDLFSDYSKEYQATARRAVEAVKGKSEREVIAMINKLSVEQNSGDVRQ